MLTKVVARSQVQQYIVPTAMRLYNLDDCMYVCGDAAATCLSIPGDDRYYLKAKDCYDRSAGQTSDRACYCVTNKLCTVLYTGNSWGSSSSSNSSCYEKVMLYDSSLSVVVALASVLTLTMLMYTSLLLTCFVWKLVDPCDRTGMRRRVPYSSKEETKAQLQQ